MVVEQGFRGHVPLGACPISDFELLLELADLLNCFVVFIFNWLPLTVELQLGKTKVNQEPSLCVSVVQEVRRLDVSMHNALVSQVLNRL